MVKPNDIVTPMFNFSMRLWYNYQAVNKKNNTASLYIQVYISVPKHYEQDEFPLKLRWPIDRLDKDSCRVLARHRGDPDVNDYNMIIMDQMAKYNEIAKKFRLANRLLTLSEFKRQLKLGDPSKSFIEYMKIKRQELFVKKEISLQTFKNVGGSINTLAEYCEFIPFHEINFAWMQSFKTHLKTKNIAGKKGEVRHMKEGTVWTRMRDVKAYLKFASEEPTIQVDEAAIHFPNPEPQTITIYCNRDELRRLLILLRAGHLTDTEIKVLKAYLFQCFTSLRISDVYRANTSWMMSENLMVFTQWKGRNKKPTTVRIPIIPLAKSFVNEVAQTFFDLPTSQEYNRTLKDLARKAEINKPLKSHSGRHTFGYLYMTSVANILGLKEIMGHKKLSTTERYAHLDEDYNLTQVMKLQEGFEIPGKYGTQTR